MELLKKGKIENPPPSEVFEKALAEVYHYWFHSDKRYHIFIACWIIGSYMYVIFGRYPPLHLQGPRESGKSTLIDFLSHVAWNPTDPVCALRSAGLFRTIELNRPTYLVDITKLNPKSEEYGDIVDVFEAGWEEGHAIIRCIGENLAPVSFYTFCPKAVASRQTLPFQAKCIRIITEQARDKAYTERRRFMRWDPELPGLVAGLLRCALNLWPEVLKAYQALEQTEKLTGRAFDLWAPVLAVCKVFAPDHYEELLKLAEEDAEKRERGDLMSEVEDAVLAILFPMEGETVSFLLKELTEKVQNSVSWVKTWHPVKSAIVNLGIVKKEYQTSKGLAYNFDLERVREKAQARGVVPEEAPSREAESQKPIMVAVKDWCRAYRDERGEISLEDLAKFIKEELHLEPQRVIAEAYKQGILMPSPKPGKAVVV
ncbi:MAG: hypothetical protein QMD10_10145 [Desulfitobacteriaceae bacterium]|nr:hypothetical protein [Desulfitobacteriaceae bacterium]